MRRFTRTLLSEIVAGAVLLTPLLLPASSSGRLPPAPADGASIFLPAIYSDFPPAPTGSYLCYEYEFGLIWTSEVITLSVDGSSVYAFAPPYARVVTGTWLYLPAAREIAFTNFSWITATYGAPGRLWARRYLPQAGFEIALECQRSS